MTGFVKIHRTTDDLFANDELCRQAAWYDLIKLAAWTDHETAIGNTVVTLKRGDLIGSLSWLAERWKWSVKRVRNFLALLEKDGRIKRGIVRGRVGQR